MNPTHRPAGNSRRADSSSAGRTRRRGGADANVRAARVASAVPGDARAWWRHPAPWVALFAVALYAASVGYGFVRDDHELIRANPFLRRDGFLVRLLTSDFWRASGRNSGMWRPLVVLSYWVDGRAFQWQPWGFHAVNLVAHAAASALVAWLVLAAGAGGVAAFLAGAWFAAMPAHVESVAWISGRTDVLCGLFVALALLLDRRARRAGRAWAGVPATLAFTLALLSKEAALPFVAILAVAEWIETERRFTWSGALRWLAPYAAITLAFVLVHETLASRWVQPPSVDPATTGLIRLAGWIMVPQYVAMLWPWYPHSPDIALQLPNGPWTPGVLGGIVATLGMIVLATGLAWRRSRGALPVALFALPLLTFSVLAWVRSYLTFAERLVYLPSIGAAWLLGLGVAAAARRPGPLPRVVYAAAALLVAASAWQTLRLVPQWSDDLVMFRAMTEVQPENAKARIGYANQLAAAGREREALEQLAKAEVLDPRLSETSASRAVVYFRHGDWPDVLASADHSLALDPTNPQARLLRATALMRLRRLDEAAVVLQQMMADDPGDPATEGIWGQVLMLRHQPAQAIPYLEHALAWQGDDASVAYALGVAHQLVGEWPQARDAFAITVRIDPRYYEGWLRLATAAQMAGDAATRDRAIAAARTLPESRDGRAERLAGAAGSR